MKGAFIVYAWKSVLFCFIAFLLVVFALLTPLPASAQTTCHLITTSNASQVPSGYGMPFNVLTSAREMLIRASCATTSVTVDVGVGNNLHYIYKQGYEWRGTAWAQYTLTGSNAAGDWLVGSARTTLNRSASELAEPNWFVAYVCQWTGSQWKCGCRDSACSTPYWQLQGFQLAAGAGSGGDAAGGTNATFPFVTVSNPPLRHNGVENRPGYNASNPLSAAVTDPMSGIRIVRVGGNAGSPVYISGTQNTGLVFPQRLRNENSPSMQKVWNADGSLLMIDRHFSQSGDPSNSVGSYLIDVTGEITGAPFRIIRASRSAGLGEGVGVWWMWDPKNPRRAFVVRDNGSIDEWWPIGGNGNPVGKVNNLFGPVSVCGSHHGGRRHMLQTSMDGRYYVSGCRRNSDGRWGGIRRDLMTGALGPFIPTPHTFNNDGDRSTQGTSVSGRYTSFTPNGNEYSIYNTETGRFVSRTTGDGIAHTDWAIVDGREYLIGMRAGNSGFRMWDIEGARWVVKATAVAGSNPQHTSTRNTSDLFQTHGAAGGSTSGIRYAVWVRSHPNSGHPRAILGIRLGANDRNAIRFLANHRSVVTTNSNEVHVQPSPNGRYVAFSSNWHEPGRVNDGHVHPYVILVPEAWWRPNNDGS